MDATTNGLKWTGRADARVQCLVDLHREPQTKKTKDAERILLLVGSLSHYRLTDLYRSRSIWPRPAAGEALTASSSSFFFLFFHGFPVNCPFASLFSSPLGLCVALISLLLSSSSSTPQRRTWATPSSPRPLFLFCPCLCRLDSPHSGGFCGKSFLFFICRAQQPLVSCSSDMAVAARFVLAAG